MKKNAGRESQGACRQDELIGYTASRKVTPAPISEKLVLEAGDS
jgi:hypothetical protein